MGRRKRKGTATELRRDELLCSSLSLPPSAVLCCAVFPLTYAYLLGQHVVRHLQCPGNYFEPCTVQRDDRFKRGRGGTERGWGKVKVRIRVTLPVAHLHLPLPTPLPRSTSLPCTCSVYEGREGRPELPHIHDYLVVSFPFLVRSLEATTTAR